MWLLDQHSSHKQISDFHLSYSIAVPASTINNGLWGLKDKTNVYIMFKFLISLTICLGLYLNSNAQSLKIYSGKYKRGKATYSYRDNPEGGRIFEGDFTYTYSYPGIEGSVTGSASGKFKNNKKDGVWKYVKNTTNILKATYKNGVLDGLYEYTNTALVSETFSLTIRDGKFIGNVKGTNILYSWSGDKTLHNYTARVAFNGQLDNNGCFDGKWTFKDLGNDFMFYAIYEHGNCKSYYREDLTTGDIETGKGTICYALNQIITDNYDRFEQMVDRNNKIWVWYAVNENDHQDKKEESIENPCEGEVFNTAEQMPEFSGGQSQLMNFISKNLKYPEEAEANGIQGRVTVEFIVNKDGSISDAKVPRSLDLALDEEAIRIVQSMPNWKPGKQHGKPVRVKFSIPVMFRLK